MNTSKTKRLIEWKEQERLHVAGVQYSDYQKLSKLTLRAGAAAKLVCEPNNPVDKDAIKVEVAGVHIGWIPADKTSWLHTYRRRNIQIRCTVTAVNYNNPTWQMIVIKIEVPANAVIVDEDRDFYHDDEDVEY